MESIGNILAEATTPMALGDWHDHTLWIIIVGFVVAFFLAFGVGANDVANQFGTSVGAKVISLRNACIIATIFELLGAILIGSRVSDTIRKKIVDVTTYDDSPEEYMLGNLAALGGSGIWLLAATFLKMPISGTHSIVGAVLGFSLVAKGTKGIDWVEIGKIVGSWFLSPVLSGCVSAAIFYGINRFILQKNNSVERGLWALPIFYGATIFINIASILLDGPDYLQIKTSLPNWTETIFGLIIATMLAAAVIIVVMLWFVPMLRRQIQDMEILAKNEAEGAKHAIFVIGQSGSGSGSSDSSEVEAPMNVPTVTPKTDSQMITNTFGFIPELNHNLNTKIENEKNANVLIVDTLEIIPTENSATGTGPGITPNNSEAPLIKTSLTSEKDVELGFEPVAVSTMTSSEDGITFHGNKEGDDEPGVGKLFSFLQVMTAAFGSFAHGGNDVSNAIGPLIALWLVHREAVADTETSTPIWLLIYGGVGISAGLWIWGRRVIKTMGEDLTKITPSSGFTIEIGAAITVLLASKIGVPVSTTHCKVGSVVVVGWMRSNGGGVDWSLFRNIIFAWLVTVPVSAGLSALIMWILKSAAL